MDGIFIAVLLETHVAYSFYAHAYAHQTPMTVVVCTVDGKEKVCFYLDFFQVFAWGSGGARDVDNSCDVIINGRRPRHNDELPPIPPRKSSSLFGRMSKLGRLCRCVRNSRTHLVDQYEKYHDIVPPYCVLL
eukprot:6544485-Ditylum_brightwellii.AAC.1